MKRCIIQYLVGRRPSGVDEEDLDWRTIRGESYPVDQLDQAWLMAETYDSDFDHRMTHRVVIADIEPEELVAKPPVKAAPAPVAVKPAARMALGEAVHASMAARLEGSPKPAPPVKRQLAEFRAQARCLENLARLKQGFTDRVSFGQLQPLVDLLEADLVHCGNSVLTASFREQFAQLRALVDGKPGLRVVK
jgi:hypothetical protein